MILSDELRQAAEALGESLRASESVSVYLEAQRRLEADADASGLDDRLTQMYQDLIARQRAGESLPQAEIEDFNTLRDKAFGHPLVAGRNTAFTLVKSNLADIADVLSETLGIDYAALAQPI